MFVKGRTLWNIWTVNSGNAAATPERMNVLTAKAEALYILQNKAR